MKKITITILLFFTGSSLFAGYSGYSGSRSYSSGYSSRSYNRGYSSSYSRPTSPVTNAPKTYTQQTKPMPPKINTIKSTIGNKTGITSGVSNARINSNSHYESGNHFYSNWWVYLMLFGNNNSNAGQTKSDDNEKTDCKDKEYFKKHTGLCKANGHGW